MTAMPFKLKALTRYELAVMLEEATKAAIRKTSHDAKYAMLCSTTSPKPLWNDIRAIMDKMVDDALLYNVWPDGLIPDNGRAETFTETWSVADKFLKRQQWYLRFLVHETGTKEDVADTIRRMCPIGFNTIDTEFVYNALRLDIKNTTDIVPSNNHKQTITSHDVIAIGGMTLPRDQAIMYQSRLNPHDLQVFIQVVKDIREKFGLSLKASKNLAEALQAWRP
jgi:hypothetical protein